MLPIKALQPGTWASKLVPCQLTDFGSLPCRQPRLLCARPLKFVEKAARKRGRRRGHLSHIAAGRNPELANAARGRSLTVAALYCRARPRKSSRVPKTLWCSTTPNQGFASRVGQASLACRLLFQQAPRLTMLSARYADHHLLAAVERDLLMTMERGRSQP